MKAAEGDVKLADDDGEAPLERRFHDIGAKALIEECNRLSGAVASLSKKLADVERSAETIQSLLEFPLAAQGASQTPLMKSVAVTAKMFCNPGDGFYALEFSADGTAFRWTGPQPDFRFVVYVDRRRERRAELTLIDNEHLNDVAEIACYVDRSWVKSELRRVEGQRLVTASAVIPKLDVNRGTEILFMSPNVIVPRQRNPDSMDDRSLGVQFVELRIGGSGDAVV
jgi:hypothetical protein